MLKKILKIISISLLVLIVAAFSAPYLFKSQIVSLVKKEINKRINAKVDFKEVDISFFRHFPKVAVSLDGLQIVGNGVFAADTLLSANRIDAALNVMSVIKGSDMTIYSINVESPRIHAIVTKDSLTNWDIMKPDTAAITATESKPYKMALQQYAAHNGYISYKDATAGIATEITNLNHEGSGDFTSDLFTLKTTTNADAITVSYGGIPYLSNAKVVIDADIQVDKKTNTYSFNTDKILVNGFKITTKGSIKNMAEKGYGMDITFNAPSTDFKNILSLVPAMYKNDFDKIKTSGTALFGGFVKGTYNEKTIPAYHVDMEVKEGFFQYP
ncbi:MAG: AsmA family protein, partial [Ferruginibacter sp.]|nr:AsmA family protein [Ferruginibacter sp.]